MVGNLSSLAFQLGLAALVTGQLRTGRRGPAGSPAASCTPAAAVYVGAGHLAVGYAVLGLIPALRPELTGARDRTARPAPRPSSGRAGRLRGWGRLQA